MAINLQGSGGTFGFDPTTKPLSPGSWLNDGGGGGGMGGSTGGPNLGYGFPPNPWQTSAPIGLSQPGTRTDGNVVFSTPGDQEKQLDSLFSNAVGGNVGSQQLGNQLHSLAMGILPQPMANWITATANENFGHLGARFGSDLGNAIAQGLGVAGARQSLDALNSLFNLGGTTAGFQFNRGENALQRAVQTYGIDKQASANDPLLELIGALLGG